LDLGKANPDLASRNTALLAVNEVARKKKKKWEKRRKKRRKRRECSVNAGIEAKTARTHLTSRIRIDFNVCNTDIGLQCGEVDF